MASYSYTFVSGDTVTPTKLNNARTVSDIVNADIKSDAAIAHTKLANITAGQVLLGNGSNVPTATALSGDVTVNSSGVTAIGSGVIVDADINASAAIGLSKLATGALPTAITVASANLVDGTIVNADINASAAIDLSKLATGALPSAITVASANIVNDTIVNADINSAAAIAHSKLANITAGSILMGNASNLPTATALTGDVTISSSGVTAIGSGVVVNADISASAGIEGSKLANATITATQLASNAVETAKINNGAVTGPKLADGMVVQVVYAEELSTQLIDQTSAAAPVTSTTGEEVITATITPTSSTNKILVEVLMQGGGTSGSGSGLVFMGLFRDAGASSIANASHTYEVSYSTQVALCHQDSPATTSAVTYKIRCAKLVNFLSYDKTGITVRLTEIKAS